MKTHHLEWRWSRRSLNYSTTSSLWRFPAHALSQPLHTSRVPRSSARSAGRESRIPRVRAPSYKTALPPPTHTKTHSDSRPQFESALFPVLLSEGPRRPLPWVSFVCSSSSRNSRETRDLLDLRLITKGCHSGTAPPGQTRRTGVEERAWRFPGLTLRAFLSPQISVRSPTQTL